MPVAETSNLRLSVIVTTYNNPRALRLVLAGLERQTVGDFEVVIADDGSGPETREVIDAYRRQAPFALRHVWQPDEGFRKCAILNRAVREASGDYLFFFDGDCVPPAHCLRAHLRAARREHYVCGAMVLLSARFGERLTVQEVAGGRLDRFGRWWYTDVDRRHRLLISRVPGLRWALDRNRKRGSIWGGSNSSTFAEHVYRVGGFDERFTYGFEDADFGLRLEAAGIRGRSIRYTAPVFALDHPRPYVDVAQIGVNRALMEANRAAGMIFTPYGLPRQPPESATQAVAS